MSGLYQIFKTITNVAVIISFNDSQMWNLHFGINGVNYAEMTTEKIEPN